MCTQHYKDGKFYILDDEADARKKAQTRGQSSSVAFHIFNEAGDLYSNEKKLDDFCLSWGVPVKGKFLDQKRNALFEAIETAEKNSSTRNDYGYDAFNRSIADNDPYFQIRADVQDALNKNIIKFDKTKYVVTLQNGEVFCRIPIEKAEIWKNVLFEFLAKKPDKLEALTISSGDAPTHEPRKLEVEGSIDETYIMNADYPDLKILTKEITGLGYKDLNKMKKPELQDALKKWYCVDMKTRP
jgi:hypothetical protein